MYFRRGYLLLIPLFALIYYVFRSSNPAPFHHTKAVFTPKETASEEFERIFASPLDKFDWFYQLDFTAQRLRLLPKLIGVQYQAASAALFPWFDMQGTKHKSNLLLAASNFDGSGVVMIVNNINIQKVLITLKNLQKSVAVELFYMGKYELSDSNYKILKTALVTPVDLFKKFPKLEGNVNDKMLIPFAILASSFEHVIFVESGSILFTTPESLSLEHLYQRYGVLFFKDSITNFSDNDNYYSFGMAQLSALNSYDSSPSNPFVQRETSTFQNPSLLMIDKVRGYSGLIAVCSIMMTSGGKSPFLAAEIFWVIFDSIGAEYSFYPGSPRALFDASNGDYSKFDKVYLDANENIIWMGGQLIATEDFSDDKGAIKLPNSLKLAAIETIVHGEKGKKSIVPFQVHSLTDSQSQSVLSAAKSVKGALESFILLRGQPKQISPWSYTSVGCNPSTSQAAFNEWIEERIDFWNSLDDKFLIERQQELFKFVNTLNLTKSAEKSKYSGNGIIYSCHPGIVKSTAISIKIVRKLGCNLPIQLW